MKDTVKQYEVEEWFLSTDGPIHLRDAKRDLELDPSSYPALRTIFTRLVKKNIAEHVKGKDGWYRRIEKDWEDIDIFGDAQFYILKDPFDMDRYVRIARGGLVVIAGVPGSGKTGWCLNVAMMNCEKHDIWYFDSESGSDLLQERLFAMNPDLSPPLPFSLKRLDRNAEDTVKAHPDSITILDYIEEPDEAWRVSGILKRITESLGNGLAIVALQKPPGRDAAYGGPQVLNKPQVYLALNSNSIKIVKAKSRVVNTINPNNMKWGFTLDCLGTKFIGANRIYEEGEAEEEPQLPF